MKYYPLKNYENIYWINKKGNVKNNNGEIIKPFENEDGYYRISLWKNNRKRNFYIRQLIAKQFIPNPNKYKEIDHQDRNRKNNSVDNLIWCDRSMNNLNRNF